MSEIRLPLTEIARRRKERLYENVDRRNWVIQDLERVVANPVIDSSAHQNLAHMLRDVSVSETISVSNEITGWSMRSVGDSGTIFSRLDFNGRFNSTCSCRIICYHKLRMAWEILAGNVKR